MILIRKHLNQQMWLIHGWLHSVNQVSMVRICVCLKFIWAMRKWLRQSLRKKMPRKICSLVLPIDCKRLRNCSKDKGNFCLSGSSDSTDVNISGHCEYIIKQHNDERGNSIWEPMPLWCQKTIRMASLCISLIGTVIRMMRTGTGTQREGQPR